MEYFVKIPMKMFAFNTEWYVSDDEMWFYYEICKNALLFNPGVTITNIDLLSEIPTHIESISKYKIHIRECINSLASKGYINIEPSKYGNATMLTIEHNNNAATWPEMVSNGVFKYSGWQKLNLDQYNKITGKHKGRKIKIMAYADWRANIDRDISLSEWALTLELSDRRVQDSLRECEELGLVNIRHGAYYINEEDKLRQMKNGYSLGDEEYTIEELLAMDYGDYLKTQHWYSVRNKVFKRAKYQCELCGSKDTLNAHHKTYANLGKEKLSDIIVLCKKCHQKFHDIVKE
jgi:hypothetical protein